MAFSVLPVLDLQTGQVQFRADGRWHTRYVADPIRLDHLISRSTRRPRFDPVSGELVVFVAAAGRASGQPVAFSLAKFPATGALTTLGG